MEERVTQSEVSSREMCPFYLANSHLSSYSNVNTCVMAELLHVKKKGGSPGGVTGRGKPLLTAAADKGNTVSHSNLIHEKPKKLQYSSKNVFSIGSDKGLFSSLNSPPQMRTCHHCGLFGFLRCSRCKQIHYCSANCQKQDWPAHSVVCRPTEQNVSNNRGCKLRAKTEKRDCLKGNSTSGESLKTEEHIKKIMLSDLQTLEIKKDMKVQGTITEFKSPSEFYIQMSSPEVLDQIGKLSVKLQDCYANTVNKEQYIAIKGEVCIARCSLDQTWNRALVKDVDIVQKKAQVFYIDYGNEENIPLSWIKALHKDLELLFPPCAIKCSFANYDPKEKGWNEGITSSSSQLMGQHCSATVVDVLEEEMMLSFVVDDVLPDFADNLQKVPLEMRSGLTAGSTAKGVDSSKDQLPELQLSLNEHCDKLPSSPAFHPAVGSMCCAQFTEDNLWYRAAVITHVSEDTVLAAYVDYGNSEVLPLTRLRPVIPRLMELPAQAIKCTLAGVKPPLGAWTSKAISFMKQLVKGKVLIVKVVDKEGYRSVVELEDASVTPVINISSCLIEKGCAAEESTMDLPAIGMSDAEQANAVGLPKVTYCQTQYWQMEQHLSMALLKAPKFLELHFEEENQTLKTGTVYQKETTNQRVCKWSKLTLKQTVDVVVCMLYSPGEFYCQISNNSELHALNLLNKSLSEYCQKTPPNVFKPENGDPCCAFFSCDGNWYRALVQNVTSHGTVQVYFVDYGNVEEVPLDKIRQISSSFLELPFQGIKCWLSGVKPGNSRWMPEATARFCMYTAGIKLQARVTSLSKDGAGVELIDNSTGHPKVINEILIYEKLAVKEVVQDKKDFSNKSVDEKETPPGHWKSIELAIGETRSVCVREVVSPDLFYAVPVQTKDQEKLRRQLIELEDYCKSCKNQPFKPKPGEACCARFSGDGRWYRALVLTASQSVVKVLYADRGYTETLPPSKVLPITDSYLKLPFQTITCSLAGVEKAEWSPLLLDKLEEMLLNKFVTITVKGINGNVNLVTVEKLCENGSLNVADQLVMEGLVKSSSAENSHTEHQGNGSETRCCCREFKMQVRFRPSTFSQFVLYVPLVMARQMPFDRSSQIVTLPALDKQEKGKVNLCLLYLGKNWEAVVGVSPGDGFDNILNL
ncbi:tudor domain-containing protein 1 [Podargus strigoides]